VDDTKITVEGVIPIAGNYETSNGKGLEPKFERLKSKDTQTEGLLMEIHGGQYAKKNQKAVIKFECDLDRTGNEGFEAVEGNMVSEGAGGLLDQKGANSTNFGAFVKDDPEDDKQDDGKSLTFVSYDAIDEKTDVLRLNWRTKYACEDFEDDDDDSSNKSSHWGFFTWFIIMSVPQFLGFSVPSLTALQRFSRDSDISNFRFMVELQSLWRSRLGFATTWRHYQRYPLPIQGLVKEGCRHSTRRWVKRRV